MVKRQLEEKEKAIINKNIPIIKKEIEYIKEVVLPKTLVALKCAPFEYQKQVDDLETRKRECEAQIEEADTTLTILADQLENGVEVKENIDDRVKEISN